MRLLTQKDQTIAIISAFGSLQPALASTKATVGTTTPGKALQRDALAFLHPLPQTPADCWLCLGPDQGFLHGNLLCHYHDLRTEAPTFECQHGGSPGLQIHKVLYTYTYTHTYAHMYRYAFTPHPPIPRLHGFVKWPVWQAGLWPVPNGCRTRWLLACAGLSPPLTSPPLLQVMCFSCCMDYVLLLLRGFSCSFQRSIVLELLFFSPPFPNVMLYLFLPCTASRCLVPTCAMTIKLNLI